MNILNENAKKFIEKYEKISKKESKLFGEVFTTKKLIREMLDTLPKEVWKNKDLKWLDPAAGINNFFSEVIDRLMVGLSDEIKDDKERFKWIVEEMLYICELQAKNMFIIYQLFDRNNEFKLNTFRGSFLPDSNGICEFDNHMKNVWKINGFDVILGNPPYQSPDVDKGQSHIYHLFIKKSIELTNDYVLFVTPPTFLKNKISVVKNAKFIYINSDVKKYFPNVGTSFIFYVLQKTKSDIKTQIFDGANTFEIEIDYDKLIPVGYFSKESFSIIDKIYNQKTERKFSFKRNETPFPKNAAFIRRMNRNKYFSCLKTDSKFNLKVNQDYTSIVDVDNLISLLNSKLFSFFYLCYSTSPFITLDFINNVPFPVFDFKNKTDDDIYKFYNLTKEEIKLIEDTIK